MLRQRFCCWRASHKIRHKQNKHIIEKTNKQNTKQLIFNFLILNALNVNTKSILVVLFIHDWLYLSTGKRISDSNKEFNAKKDAYCTKKTNLILAFRKKTDIKIHYGTKMVRTPWNQSAINCSDFSILLKRIQLSPNPYEPIYIYK